MRPGLLSLGIALLGFCLVPPVAAADVSCSYDELSPPGPQGNVLSVTESGSKDAVLARNGDAIEVSETFGGEQNPPVACAGGNPTVTNIDTVAVTIDPQFVINGVQIDLRGGAFGPGATDEGDGTSEIEFVASRADPNGFSFTVQGGDGADDFRFGSSPAGEVNLNAAAEPSAPDVDVDLAGENLVFPEGGKGNDIITAAGGPEFASPLSFDLGLTVGTGSGMFGGPGDDLLIGTSEDDDLNPQDGNDRVRGKAGRDIVANSDGKDRISGGPGPDRVFVSGHGTDLVRCGPDHDLVHADGTDYVAGDCEHVKIFKPT